MHGFQDRGLDVPRGRFAASGRFGRLFPELRTLHTFSPGPHALGAHGGPMDGGSPPPSDTSQDNPRIKAGYTFLGQFMDHDLTLDATSILEKQIDVGALHNFRTPAFELDSVYGLGPGVQPSFYDRNVPFTLLTSTDGKDLPRNHQGTALLGDPRNDENIIVSQLHLAFLKFHNSVFLRHTNTSLGGLARFEEAQKLVRWHYQWIVLNEFLPRIAGTQTTKRALRRLRFSFTHEAFMPVEFSVAAYRFGHSQVRSGYALGEGRGALLFPADPEAPPGQQDLRGGRPVPPELQVEWDTFFGPNAQPSKLIDTKISSSLLRLPDGVVPPGTPDPHRSLAVRNLQRGIDISLPSGNDVAAHLQIKNRLKERELWQGVAGGRGEAPLWFYCLREAEIRGNGNRLAGTGAEIVAGVIIALLQADRASYVSQNPGWKPTLPSSTKGRFSMSDLLNIANGTAIGSEDTSQLPGDDTI